jgi:hypothetical protein
MTTSSVATGLVLVSPEGNGVEIPPELFSPDVNVVEIPLELVNMNVPERLWILSPLQLRQQAEKQQSLSRALQSIVAPASCGQAIKGLVMCL